MNIYGYILPVQRQCLCNTHACLPITRDRNIGVVCFSVTPNFSLCHCWELLSAGLLGFCMFSMENMDPLFKDVCIVVVRHGASLQVKARVVF